MGLNIWILVYIAALCTACFGFLISKQKWSLFFFLRKESVESLERKLYGFEQSINATIITDEAGRVSSVNEAMESLFGWSEEELIRSGLKKIVPDRFWVAHSEGMKRAMGSQMEDKVFHLTAMKKDKSEIPIELLLRKRKIGGAFFYVSIIRDETQEKQMIEAYAEETHHLQSKLDILEKGEEIGCTGSWFWDLRTSKENPRSKLYTSKGFNKIMGLEDKGYVDAEYLKARVFSKDVAIVKEAEAKAFKGERYDITYRTNTSDFRVVYIRTIVQPVRDESGLVVGMYGATKRIQTLNVIDIITDETNAT